MAAKKRKKARDPAAGLGMTGSDFRRALVKGAKEGPERKTAPASPENVLAKEGAGKAKGRKAGKTAAVPPPEEDRMRSPAEEAERETPYSMESSAETGDSPGAEAEREPLEEAVCRRRRNDARSVLLARCAEAAGRGAEAMARPKKEEPPSSGGEERSFLFDILNSCVSPFDGTETVEPMPLYACVPGIRPLRCSRQGVYREALVSCYELFCDENRQETERLQQSILNLAIQDAAGGKSVKPGFGVMCLMPDIADDFNRVFRSQLHCQGAPLFQVPRSIALAYTLRVQGAEVPRAFLCVDFDGEEPCAIEVREVEGEDGPVFVRMGRKKMPPGEYVSYRKLAEDYLWRYQRKYGLTLTREALSSLVDTKLLQQLIQDPETAVLVDNGGTAVLIRRDEIILDVLRKKVLEDLGKIRSRNSIPAYGLSSFFAGGREELFDFRQLERGCLEIRRRGEAGEKLWREYLPHLELEVNRNGVFDIIELIGEDHRRQDISTFLLEEVVEIPVSNGVVTFPANGEDHYDLPLLREVYGRRDKEKLARFHLEEPLEQDMEVELTVYYRYGDVDSYKLIARSPDLEAPLESVWCDGTETLENLAPQYQELERHPFGQREFEKVFREFRGFANHVRGQTRPQTARYESVYELPGGSELYSSKYLYGLNQRGMPYFPIQEFFKLENFDKNKAYIQVLLEEGIFDCVAKVLQGELPVGHHLDTGAVYGKRKETEDEILIRNMAEIACNFGCFYILKDRDPEKTQVKETVEKVLRYFQEKEPMEIQEWAPMTRYVPRDQDIYGVWDGFSKALRQLNPKRPGRTIYDLRSVSGVCYQTKNWIFEFYHGPNGRRDVNRLLKNILAVLYAPECIAPKAGEKYNPRKIRDVLELLLCICRLKEEDPTILDCNDPETKKLVKQLKVIDRSMRELRKQKLLKTPFNSRLGIQAPKAYRGVNPVIYALIQTLTGGKPVSLIGFTSDEERRGTERRPQRTAPKAEEA